MLYEVITTKNGRVRHGNIEGNMFVRFVSHKDINWSEKAFSLNTSVMPTLKKEGVGTLKFYYRGKQFDRVYLYPLEEAFKIGNLVQLDGEENLRMPIDDKYVSEIIKRNNFV